MNGTLTVRFFNLSFFQSGAPSIPLNALTIDQSSPAATISLSCARPLSLENDFSHCGRAEFASKHPMRPWNVTAHVSDPTSVGAPVTSLMRSTSVTPFGNDTGVCQYASPLCRLIAAKVPPGKPARTAWDAANVMPAATRRLSGTARAWKLHFCSPVCALNAITLPSIVRTMTTSLPTSGGEMISPGAVAVQSCLPSGPSTETLQIGRG